MTAQPPEAAYFPSIEKKYGQPISYWIDLINSNTTLQRVVVNDVAHFPSAIAESLAVDRSKSCCAADRNSPLREL